MDRVIEKTKAQRLKKYWPYMGVGCLVLAAGCWLIFGNHASTLKVSKDELTISDVQVQTVRCCPSRLFRSRLRKAAS